VHSLVKVAHKLVLIGTAVVLACSGSPANKIKGSHGPTGAEKAAIKKGLDRNHLAFVKNEGQWDRRAEYRAQSGGLDYWLRNDGVTFDYHRPGMHNGKKMRIGQVVKMSFVGSNGTDRIAGSNPEPHPAHYLAKRTGKMLEPSAYNEVTARNVYRGIDFRSYYEGQRLRYDFIAAPGADPSKIQLKFEGASKIKVEKNDVRIGTQLGEFAHGKLFAYQTVNGRRVAIPARFVSNAGHVGFSLGAYDHAKPLVIDPVVYGSYYGGDNGWDCVTNVVADQAGNVFMTGWTQATLFPVTAGPYFISLKGTQNAFVARLQGDAYNIDYSAFFGGSNSDYGQFITVDQFNNVWITGQTTSPDFPLNTKVNTSPNQPNVFIMRWQASPTTILDPTTNPAIQMVGYDGGVGDTTFINGFAIVPDPNPLATDPVQIVMVGKSDQATPEVPGSYLNGMGFILRYSYAAGTFTNVVGATQYIGDGLTVDIGGVAVDNVGNMYICGDVGDQTNNYDTSQVGATTFVTTPGVFTGGRLLQKNDLFIRKYTAAGAMVYSCLIGGSGNEYIGGVDVDQAGTPFVSGNCIAIDSLGNAYITGNCNSFDYPRTRGAFGEIFDVWQNVVVTKISPDASQIIYSTNLKVVGLGEKGCQSSVVPCGIAVDQSGQAFITGNIDVALLTFPFPPPPNPVDPTGYVPGSVQTGSSTTDAPLGTAYVTPMPPDLPTGTDWMNVLDPTGTKLIYGTYLGHDTDQKVFGPYLDAFGDVWVNGWSDSTRIEFDPVRGPIQTNGAVANGLITSKAFKQNGDAGQGGGFLGGVLFGIIGVPAPVVPLFITEYEAKDGWLAKFSIGRPIVSQVNLNPTTIPGGLGASTQCGIVLSSAAPVQGAVVTIDLLTPNKQATGAASFDPNNIVTTTTVTVPGGATSPTSTITIYSEAVTAPSQVLVRAYYQGNFLIAPLSVIPWLQNFSVTPSGTIGGNGVTGTIVLAAPAPAGGVTVQLQSSSALLTPPASVTINAGQSTAQVPISTSGVDLKSFPIVTASFLGYGIAQAVELDPASIVSVVLNPTRVSGGTTINGTVTLNGLPGPNFPTTTVLVQTNPVGYIVTPGTLTFDSNGQATFTIQTPYENAVITRVCEVDRPSAPGTDYTNQQSLSNFIVDPTPLFTFTLSQNSANPGDTVNGTVSLSSPADSNGAVVQISADSNIVSVPSTVVVPSGSTGATFPIQVGATVVTTATTVHITATRGPNAIQRTLLVNPSTFVLSLSQNSVLGGNVVTGTITLGNPAPNGGLAVGIGFNPNGIASISAPVVVPAGASSVNFAINTVPQTSNAQVTITATAGSLSSQQTLTVRAPSLASISFTPSTVIGLRTTVCRISLDGPAAAGGTIVTLAGSNPLAATLPPSVTIPAGKSTYAFAVLTRRVSRALTDTVTASSNSTQVSATFTVVRY